MNDNYHSLMTLTKTLNENQGLINSLLEKGKDEFSNNEEHITIAIGIINEIKQFSSNIDLEIFMLNKRLYDTIMPIVNYSNNLFNNYNIVNSYKLYDVIKLDVQNLKDLLNSFIK